MDGAGRAGCRVIFGAVEVVRVPGRAGADVGGHWVVLSLDGGGLFDPGDEVGFGDQVSGFCFAAVVTPAGHGAHGPGLPGCVAAAPDCGH